MTALVLGEVEGTALKESIRNAVTAALKMAPSVEVLLCGADVNDAALLTSKIVGVTRVVAVNAAFLATPTAEAIAAQILAVVSREKYSHVVAVASGMGKSVMPRVAARLDVAQVSEITHVESPDTFVRPIYAGSAFATVQMLDDLKVITVRSTAFEAAVSGNQNAPIEVREAAAEPSGSRVQNQVLTRSSRPDLVGATVVVSGGRGLGSSENFKLLETLALKLNAALGASRAAVDAGYVPNDFQVGQTGKVVAPDLYIAVGISGAIQHLAGMKDSKIIVAINKDPDAPIFQVADYGLVGDLFEIIPQLTAELK